MGAVCSSLVSTKRLCYNELQPELLDLVIDRLPDPADRARARAVCRSWHAAVRRHGPQPWRMPSRMSTWRRFRTMPRGADVVGSTDDWLALRIGGRDAPRQSYLLHNPFLHKAVPLPLPELDAVMAQQPHKSMVYKFLMRSDGLIAVITNNMRHAFMVFRPGKGAWLPPPRTRPYVDIIDLAFLQGKLYAITTAEDLIPFDVTLDNTSNGDEGRPPPPPVVVAMGRRLITKQPDYHEEEQVAAYRSDITTHNCSLHIWPRNGHDVNLTSRHLVESRGKLLMVRHHQQILSTGSYVTLGVEVFEADTDAGAWMPVTGGLGGGRALFISIKFSKSVAAPCGEVEEDAIYFINTGEVFNLKSGASTPSRLCTSSSFSPKTWLFHPELVF